MKKQKRTKGNPGFGRGYTFHGSFGSLILARRRERAIPHSFILKRGDRYYVIRRKRAVENPSRSTRKKNHKRLVRIYGRVLRIEAQKIGPHRCDAECRRCQHKYFHDFRTRAVMYGQPDGSILIKGA